MKLPKYKKLKITSIKNSFESVVKMCRVKCCWVGWWFVNEVICIAFCNQNYFWIKCKKICIFQKFFSFGNEKGSKSKNTFWCWKKWQQLLNTENLNEWGWQHNLNLFNTKFLKLISKIIFFSFNLWISALKKEKWVRKWD